MSALIDTIPDEVRRFVESKKVLEVGWAAGPSWIVRKTNEYESPVLLEVAFDWLEGYREIYRLSHVLLEDRSVIWMKRDGLFKYDGDDRDLKDSGTFVEVEGKEVQIEIDGDMGDEE